jgi:hypothetical protein
MGTRLESESSSGPEGPSKSRDRLLQVETLLMLANKKTCINSPSYRLIMRQSRYIESVYEGVTPAGT